MSSPPAPACAAEEREQLWTDLERCLEHVPDSHEAIDDTLRQWLDTTVQICQDHQSDHDSIKCADALRGSSTFRENKAYVQTQLIHSLLQEDDPDGLYTISIVLLLDGQYDEALFPRMAKEACFPRLLELTKLYEHNNDTQLHRLLLQLLYEVSRLERLKAEELLLVDDEFIQSLFTIIEGVSDDGHDPYHYPTIRVLLVMNEQYMLASTDETGKMEISVPLTNRIVKCISLHGSSFMTFGENIILLLNRETETSLQLLILKLLYLLFTTKATYEYFYTNDLRVLLDVIIRNVMDLPDERISLRHTYLRVMYPLLAHTQISKPPHYKEHEVLRLIKILRGSQTAHFAPADDTTLRLVERVSAIPWIRAHEERELSGSAAAAQKILGMSLSESEYGSSISVGDVAAVKEKPGVQTPSRRADASKYRDADSTGSDDSSAPRVKKPLPAVPAHRHGIPISKVTKSHLNGDMKKIPPKAPPPRRFGKGAPQGNTKDSG